MNKKLTASLLAIALLPLSAFAQDIYVAPRLGYGTLKGTFKAAAPDYEEKIGSQSKGSAVLGLAWGYDFKVKLSLPIRAELEYAYLGSGSKTHKDIDEGDLQLTKMTLGGSTLFANTYFDFHNKSAFTPYVSVGLGTSFLQAKGKVSYPDDDGDAGGSFKKKTSSKFAWNLGVGAAWKVTDNIALDLGYRYANLGKARTGYMKNFEGDTYNAWAKTNSVTAHQFLLGGRFSF